ncbi:MAG: thiamine pyrophosphate-dependent enzyme [Nanoarchaeota archaeon]
MALEPRLSGVESINRVRSAPDLNDGTGNSTLVRTLYNWGIRGFGGTNGGGKIHVAERIAPEINHLNPDNGRPRMQTIIETMAGFYPNGHYLASGRMGGCSVTTGAAGLYSVPGYVAATMQFIPGVWLAALSAHDTHGKAPLQFTGPGGFNTKKALEDIAMGGFFLIDEIGSLENILTRVRTRLQDSMPAMIAYDPSVLSKTTKHFDIPWEDKPKSFNEDHARLFLTDFLDRINGKDVVIFVGEEATRYSGIQSSITDLAQILKAPVVYTMNSANAVSPNCPYNAGFVYLGFNKVAYNIMENTNKNTVIICLGFDPGEYQTNQKKFDVDTAYHFTNLKDQFQSSNGGYQHRFNGRYLQIKGSLDLLLKEVIPELRAKVRGRPEIYIPEDLNEGEQSVPPQDGYVNKVDFFKEFSKLARPDTVVFDDVCVAYMDRQRVTQRPVSGIFRWSSDPDSTMGATFGMAAGAIGSRVHKNIHLFVGDGCFEYFGGALARLTNYGATMWVMRNGTHAIVDTGLDQIKPYLPREFHHANVPYVDYEMHAKAHGWDAATLSPDLKNLPEIMRKAYIKEKKSFLVVVPTDPYQKVGENARLLLLESQGRSTNL